MNDMYAKTEFFKTYFSRASEKKLIAQAVAKRLNKVAHYAKILDLGCHNGSLLQNIISLQREKLPPDFSIVAVDPCQPAIDEFSTNDFVKNYSTRTFNTTAECYLANNRECFDWIIASQCLYWSDDLAQIVKNIEAQSLASLIVLRGKKGIYEIQSQYKDLLGNKQEKLYTSIDIENALNAQQIIYQKESHSTNIELPPLDSTEFDWLIGFFLQHEDLTMPPATIRDVKNFIIDLAHNNKIQHDIDLFWLGKAITPSISL